MTERIHNVDGNIVELEKHSQDKWEVLLNGEGVAVGFGGLKKGGLRFDNMVDALKASGYEFEEYIVDRGDDKEEIESQFVLMEELPDGSLEDLNFSDDKSELQRILRESELG